jgi:glycosyltransferase involved in cell wall biosynthesis
VSSWDRILQTDRWFQRKASVALEQAIRHRASPPVVFAYSYAAKGILETAKKLGCRTVLGQIDPGPVEMRLVQQLERQHGIQDSEWPGSRYWEDWHAECELADAIIVNSEWSRDALLEEGIPAEQMHVIPLAYEKMPSAQRPDRHVPAIFSTDRPLRVLFLGQVIVRKGIPELAEAIRLLQGSPIEWTIVGGGDPRLLQDLRSLPQTLVTGAVSRRDVADYYRKADVFILPTHSDGFALTQLEAAVWRLPMIASERCGSVVIPGENGMRLAEVSGKGIADCVRCFVDDPAMLQRMSGSQCVSEKFSLEAVGQQFVRVAAGLELKGI